VTTHPSQAPRLVVLVGIDLLARGWIEAALRDSEFRLVGAAGSEDTVSVVADQKPDLLIVDARDEVAIALVRELRAAGVEVPALLMTVSPERGFNENARAAGAQGTLLKTGSIAELLAALRVVARGDESFDPRHPQRPSGQRELSPRERDVLRLVARGATNREIAGELSLGEETVKTLLARSCAKLGVHRRREAAIAARALRLL
jgi:DNA-binding NarL/FixJ family response regulator